MPSLHSILHAWPVGKWLTAFVACMALMMPVSGQGISQSSGSQASGLPGAAPMPTPTLASMQHALLHESYTVEQLRRFQDESGNIVTARELMHVHANGTSRPDFEIVFLGVEGEPVGSPLHVEWQQTYNRFGSLFFRRGSFQVRDLVKASGNYTVHDFGSVMHAGRLANRLVVFPTTIDKAIWVVDVDSATSLPLMVAEFDNQLRMRANIEVLTYSPVAQIAASTQPSPSVAVVRDFKAAKVLLGSPTGLLNPDVMVTPDYAVDQIEVHDDPINGRQKLVMSYCDGIDQFTVVQTIKSQNPFAGLPSAANGGFTIGRFRDPAISALIFWDDQVSFQVAGRGSLTRLDEVARRIYLQALSN